MLFDSIVPVSVEWFWVMTESLQISVTHSDSLGIAVGVQGGTHLQTRLGCCGLDQANDYFVVDEWLPAPVQADGAEQTVFNFVPLTGSRWEMAYLNFQSCLVGKFLQLCFPESDARAVATAAVCRDHQSRSVRISLFPHHEPPSPNTLHREGRRVVIGTDIDPCFIMFQVVDSIGGHLAEFFINKIVYLHLDRIALAPIRTTSVFVKSYEFFLFCVYRDDRLPPFFIGFHALRDKLELCVAIWMSAPFQGLSVTLQTIALFCKESTNRYMTNLVPFGLEMISKRTKALRSPQKWRFRITHGAAFHQGSQVLQEACVGSFEQFPAGSRSPHPSCRKESLTSQLTNAFGNYTARHASYLMNNLKPASSQCFRLRGSPKPTSFLIQMGPYGLKSNMHLRGRCHAATIADKRQLCQVYF